MAQKDDELAQSTSQVEQTKKKLKREKKQRTEEEHRLQGELDDAAAALREQTDTIKAHR